MKLLEIGKLSLCKKLLYRCLYMNTCSLDVSAIKNPLLKQLQIYSKIATVGGVQVFSLEIHPWFHFLGFSRIIRNTYFQEHLRVFFIFFFDRNISYSLCFYLFLQKNRRPVFFSSSVLLSIVIYKFTNRNSCGYCFRRFGKFLRERLQRSSLLGCRLRTLCFLTVSD